MVLLVSYFTKTLIMKQITNFFASSLLLFALLFTVNTQAQLPASCDPCPGAAWGAATTSTFTFSIPAYPGCMYAGYIKYRTRTCLGKTQVQIIGRPVFEQLTAGSGCSLHCHDAPKLKKAVYNHLFTLLGGGPILKVEESPCHYVGTIVVPPGAEICYGFTPGNTVYVTMPCDNNGCCYSELTPSGGTFYQNVIQSTPCPPTPYTPPSAEIEWECDILGGGSAKFTVAFTPDTPIVCEMTCFSGYAKPGKTTGIVEMSEDNLSNLDIYPNPATDVLHISFSAKAGNEVSVELIDITGKVITTKEIVSTQGRQTIDIDMKPLASGTYGLRIIHKDGHVMTKVVK